MQRLKCLLVTGFLVLLCGLGFATPNPVNDIPVSSASKEAVANFKKALAFFDEGNYVNARAAITKALEADSKLAIAYMYKCYTESSIKDITDDLDKAKANLANASDWEKMYYEFISNYLTNDWNKRLEIGTKIAGMYPEAARPQADLGYTYLNANKYTEAKAAFEKAVAINPNWIGGYYGLVNLYLTNDFKDVKKAEEYGVKAVAAAPKSAGAQQALGNCYQGLNEFDKAKAAYKKAIELDPGMAGAYYNLGAANNLTGNYEEARKSFNDAGNHDVNHIYADVNIGNTYLYEGDYKKAIGWLEDHAKKQESSGDDASKVTLARINFIGTATSIAWYNNDAAKLKELFAQLEPLDNKIGEELGTEESKLNSKADVLYWQGMIAAMEGNYDVAKAKAEEFKTTKEPIKDPMKLQGYDFINGYISLKQKNYTAAITSFEKTSQNDILNKYMLAMANEGAGNKEKADALYNEVANYKFDTFSNALIKNDIKKKMK